MIRVYRNVAHTGAVLAFALLNRMPTSRHEVIGWSKPGPKYRSDRGNNSIATREHRHLREVARNTRREGAFAA